MPDIVSDQDRPLIWTEDPIEWTCMVCGGIRRDKDISVHKISRSEGGVEITENIRYCNDRSECRSNAHLGLRALTKRRAGMVEGSRVEYVPYVDRTPGVSPGLLLIILLMLIVEVIIGVAVWRVITG